MQTIVNGQCGTSGVYSIVFTIYAIAFVGVVPAIVLSVFGYLAYRNVRQLHLRVQSIVRHELNQNNFIQRKDRDLLIIVIAEVFVYVITTALFPLVLLEIMISRYIIPNKSVQYSPIENFILNITYFLLFINSAIPFYIYLVSSKAFRRDSKQLIMNSYRKLTGQPTILVVPRLH